MTGNEYQNAASLLLVKSRAIRRPDNSVIK